jgi:CRP-like cAMP-binding protein
LRRGNPPPRCMAVDIELLKTVQYFDGLSTSELESIKRLFIEKTADIGELFLAEGEWSDYLYFLISGLVKVYKTSTSGKEQILHIAPPGDSLNDVSTYDGGPTAAGMVALTPIMLYAIGKEDIKAVISDYPRVAHNIIRALSRRIRRDSNLVEDLSSKQVIGRLAKLFLGKYGGEEATLGLNLTQKDMASLVGSCREMVNRSLKVMEEKGAIRLARRRVIITDKKILSEMTTDTP